MLSYLLAHIVQVRLVDGPNPYTGRVEVYISTDGLGRWGTICDGNWDIQDAKVVCHELGYPYAVGAPLNAHHGEGTGPIWLNNVQCLGNESGIFACMHNGIDNHSCFHNKDASAECSRTYVHMYVNAYTYKDIYYLHLIYVAMYFVCKYLVGIKLVNCLLRKWHA